MYYFFLTTNIAFPFLGTASESTKFQRPREWLFEEIGITTQYGWEYEANGKGTDDKESRGREGHLMQVCSSTLSRPRKLWEDLSQDESVVSRMEYVPEIQRVSIPQEINTWNSKTQRPLWKLGEKPSLFFLYASHQTISSTLLFKSFRTVHSPTWLHSSSHKKKD